MRRRLGWMAVGLVAAALGADGPPTPDEERAALRLADPELTVELVASEPAVVGPVALAWDERGRLYVAEMSDYPTAGPGGRIKRFPAPDADGRYGEPTVFAEGLPYPSGLLPWKGGLLVTAAPDLLFLKDTDGDGRADERRVILTGFAEGNQQLRVNSPTWGLDNWVYLANGRSGGSIRRPGDPPEKAVAIPRNDLRVRPDTGTFEPVAGFSQFGLPRDDWGDRFPSWNTVPIRHVVLEDRLLARNPYLAETRTVADVLDLADGGRVYSLAPAPLTFNRESVAYFNASCGPTIYRGDALGDAYLGHAFVCEPLTSLVHHRRLEPAGVTFVARRVEKDREFLASTHPWFRPVNLATGPDGALYVADFCRALVEHPAFVPEPKRGGIDFRRGHDRGRIWRISRRAAARRAEPVRLAEADAAALVAALEHPNGWRRDTAQRLLVERQDRKAVGPLRALARQGPGAVARVQALWTLDGLKALDAETLALALRDADPHVREAAARLAEGRADDCAEELIARADDPDARVRLRVAVALSGAKGEGARSALARIAARDADSPWTAEAILSGLGVDPLPFLAALGPGSLRDPTPDRAGFLAQLAAVVGARNDPAEVAALLKAVAEAPGDAAAFALLQGLARGQGRTHKPLVTWTAADPEAIRPAVAAADRVRRAADRAARDPDRPAWVRVRALEVLLDTRSAAAPAAVVAALEPAGPADLQAAAARGLARVADPRLVEALLDSWDRYALATRRVLLGSFVTSAALAMRLVEAIEGGKVPAAELDPATREALRRLNDAKLQARLDAVLRAGPAEDRAAVVRRLEGALDLEGAPARGRAQFEKHCLACHARDGRGAKVGPDLIAVVGRPKADLLTSILDPSRDVAPDGVAVVAVTTRGQTLSGLLVEETPTTVRLRRAEGVDDVVPRGEIEALRPTGRSLMPDGFEGLLSPQELADLIAYLRTPEPAPVPAR